MALWLPLDPNQVVAFIGRYRKTLHVESWVPRTLSHFAQLLAVHLLLPDWVALMHKLFGQTSGSCLLFLNSISKRMFPEFSEQLDNPLTVGVKVIR